MSTNFNDVKETNKIVANYISRKSGKDSRSILKLFNQRHFPSNEGLVKILNKTMNLPSADRPIHVESTSSADVSYKTKEIDSSGLLKDLPVAHPVYLDHGCGAGKITAEIASLIGASKVYGVDIYIHPLLYERGIEGIIPEPDGTIGLPDASIDVATCLLSLHHVTLQQKTLEELYRILRPGGVLLIYEHDFISDPGFRVFLDAVHMTFSLYGTENESEGSTLGKAKKITLESEQWIFDTKYKSRDLWRGDLERCGFKHVVDRIFKNSQRMYFAKFEK